MIHSYDNQWVPFTLIPKYRLLLKAAISLFREPKNLGFYTNKLASLYSHYSESVRFYCKLKWKQQVSISSQAGLEE